MLVHTLKNVLKYFQMYTKDDKYIISCKGNNTNYDYTFTVTKEGVSLLLKTGEFEVMDPIGDIELYIFKDKDFTIKKFEEVKFRSGETIYEKLESNIFYEAQLFVKVFRVMNERVVFTFVCDNVFYDCYYVDGKVYYIMEDDDSYRLHGTDLFKLAQSHKNYRILRISSPRVRMSHGEFMEKQNRIAVAKNKEFIKYKYDIRI